MRFIPMARVCFCFILAVFCAIGAFAKLDISVYTDVVHAPFVLGVASGEPTDTSVVIWTRAQNEHASGSFVSDQTIQWNVRTASGAPSFEINGTISARSEDDF